MNQEETFRNFLNNAKDPWRKDLLQIADHPDTKFTYHDSSCAMIYSCPSTLDLKAKYDETAPYPYMMVDRPIYLEDSTGYYIIFLKKTIIAGDIIVNFDPLLFQNPHFVHCIRKFSYLFANNKSSPIEVKNFLLL